MNYVNQKYLYYKLYLFFLQLPFKEKYGIDISETILHDSYIKVTEYGEQIQNAIDEMLNKKSNERSSIEMVKMSIYNLLFISYSIVIVKRRVRSV